MRSFSIAKASVTSNIFTKTEEDNEIIYTFHSGKYVSKISFNQRYLLNVLNITGSVKECIKLKSFDQGVLGNISVFPDSITVSTSCVSPYEISRILAVVEEYQPGVEMIKTELITLIVSANKPAKKSLPSFFSEKQGP